MTALDLSERIDRPGRLARWRRLAKERGTQFAVLAFLLAAANTYASTLAASMFLARVGAESLPYYYLVFAAFSIPVSAVFSALIDRSPRPRVFAAMLLLFLVVGGALAVGVQMSASRWMFYALYVGISTSELLLYSVYFVFVADYFTATDIKRYAGSMAVTMAAGGLAGAGLAGGLAGAIGPAIALFGIPAVVGLVVVHLGWLVRREQPLDKVESEVDEGVIESLRALPRLARRYPIVTLLAAAVFLNIFLQCLMEFVVFSIYERHFTQEQALAEFLGAVNACLNVLGVAIVPLFTDRFVPRLGVPKMNLVFPALMMGSFALLAGWGALPTAILGHVAYDPFLHSIDTPVFAMNYSAVPHRFIGRVRVFNDGIMYPVALVAAALLLIALESRITLREMAIVGTAFSVLLLAVHRRIGGAYLRGLIEMLRGGVVEFEQMSEGFRLPAQYADEASALLASPDAETVSLGLELASRCERLPSDAEIERAIPVVSVASARAFLVRLIDEGGKGLALLRRMAESPDISLRRRALETLAVRHQLSASEAVSYLHGDADETVRAIAAAVTLGGNGRDAPALAVIAGLSSLDAGISASNVLRSLDSAVARPGLEAMAHHPEPRVRSACIEAAAEHAATGEAPLVAWAWRAFGDSEGEVRATAVALLARLSPPEGLGAVADAGLRDPRSDVRYAAASALAERGPAALAAARPHLASPEPGTVEAAVTAIGGIGGREVDDLLFTFLKDGPLADVVDHLAIARTLPPDRAGWAALGIALADRSERAIKMVLHALDALGYKRTLNVVRTILAAGDVRMRANAVETLASLAHRRFVMPLLPLLEKSLAPEPAATLETMRSTFDNAWAAPDPYVRAAALVAGHAEWGSIPDAAASDGDAVVAATAHELASDRMFLDRRPSMNKLVFLKSVPLFAGLSLENLIAVDRALTHQTYLPGEAIVGEGEIGDRLFVVVTGEVAVRKKQAAGERDLAKLTAGQMFGEMSLFDDEPRSATVVAVGDAEVLSLDRDHFNSLVLQRPEILMQVCKVLVGRLRTAIS